MKLPAGAYRFRYRELTLSTWETQLLEGLTLRGSAFSP